VAAVLVERPGGERGEKERDGDLVLGLGLGLALGVEGDAGG